MPDLPRRRPQRPSWTTPIAARLTPAVRALVIIEALTFFFFVFAKSMQDPMRAYLGLGAGFFHGALWQPLTALFLHTDPFNFFLNMLAFWFVGFYIEREHGMGRFLALFFTAGILANLAIVMLEYRGPNPYPYPYDGCSFSILALFVAWGRLHGREPARIFGILAMQTRLIALLFVGLSAVVAIAQAQWGHLLATFVAAIVGYLLAAPGGLRELYDLWRARRLRRRYRVLEGGAGGGGAGGGRRARSPKYWN